MFIFFLLIILNMVTTNGKILIKDCGTEPTRTDDMSLVFYLTLQNMCETDANITVGSINCQESMQQGSISGHMCLVGGDMGVLSSKSTKNVTLLYPNLFLCGRVGSCLVSITYQTSDVQEQIQKEIRFNTRQNCHSEDCETSDCPLKFSGTRSYYSKSNGTCLPVKECPFDTVYIPKSNRCRNLNKPVCPQDLQILEEEHYEKCYYNNDLVNFVCHHGVMENKTGECICNDGWTTTTCSDSMYQPSLSVYHMCNIALNSWEEANRQKLLMTILAIAILALAVAAKMLICMCILNWCCNLIRAKRSKSSAGQSSGTGKSVCSIYQCPKLMKSCEDGSCNKASGGGSPEDGDDDEDLRSSRTFRVSFSDLDQISTGGETDISISISSVHSTASGVSRGTAVSGGSGVSGTSEMSTGTTGDDLSLRSDKSCHCGQEEYYNK